MAAFSQSMVESRFYENNPQLGGDATIKNAVTSVADNASIVAFNIICQSEGEYYVSFWINSPKLQNGTYTNYDVCVNGVKVKYGINPKVGGWHSETLKETIHLKSGANVVSVVGEIPDIPSVEHIRISKDYDTAAISSDKYDSYMADLTSMVQNISDGKSQVKYVPPYSAQNNPPYNYSYRLNADVKYSFNTTLFCTKGTYCTVNVTGNDGFEYVVDLISTLHPTLYSYTQKSDSNGAVALKIPISYTGSYVVNIRSLNDGESGICDVNINGNYSYESVPVYNTEVRATQTTLCDRSSFVLSDASVMLWLEDGAQSPGKIFTYSSVLTGNTYTTWDNCTRIKIQYGTNVVVGHATLSKSSEPTSKCDIYVGCMDSDIVSYFPNLKSVDAVQSAPASNDYNCIAWAGGIYVDWCWPPYQYSSEQTVGGNFDHNDPLACFDYFFKLLRWPGCARYTRDGATEENSVIDLWYGYDEMLQDSTYTHASIKAGSDKNAHGYAWESKPGSLMRTFHPRYALEGDEYGKVVEHYRLIDSDKATVSMEEALALNTLAIEYQNYDDDESDYLESKIKELTADEILNFRSLYNNLKNIWSNSVHSNPDILKACDEYRTLLKFCHTNENLKYYVFKLLEDGDLETIELTRDLTKYESANLKRAELAEYNYAHQKTSSGAVIMRTNLSNSIALVKLLIASEMEQQIPPKSKFAKSSSNGVSYSNSDTFNVLANNGEVTIDFPIIDKESNVSLMVMDLSGNVVGEILSSQDMPKGSYSYSMQLNKNDVYIVVFVLDGHINAKKIML